MQLFEFAPEAMLAFRRIVSREGGVRHEGEAIFSRADCCGIEADRLGDSASGCDSINGNFRTDVLPLKEAVRGPAVRPSTGI